MSVMLFWKMLRLLKGVQKNGSIMHNEGEASVEIGECVWMEVQNSDRLNVTWQ